MRYPVILILFLMSSICFSQTVEDDFEGGGVISTWFGDDCGMNNNFYNPFQQGVNTSTTVLQYHDTGGTFANVRFDINGNFNFSTKNTFAIKLFVPSNGLTGSQTNQVSLKLQDGNLTAPWSTQSEIIKPIVLDQWQEVTFNFDNDAYINLDGGSPPPNQRTDFNRVLIQVNGENNTDQVLAYIDDLDFYEYVSIDPVFDNLVWFDEFDGSGAINSANWHHQTQLPSGGSWYNNEIQHYTNRIDNTFMNGGILNLVAKKETFSDQGQTKQYTSARLNSKFAFTYGKVEIKAKLPTGVGTWPALWMLGKNINEDGAYWDNQGFGSTPWPACGEIDIMEHWGHNQNYVQSAMHTPSSFGNTSNLGGQTVSTASTDFHIYTLEWSSEKMIFSVDDVVHYTYNPAVKDANTWPFDTEQYLLFNVAILPSIGPSFTESTLEVDYIRVYQETPLSVTELEDNSRVRLYPNPVIDTLHIDIKNDGIKISAIQLLDVNGRIISDVPYQTQDQDLMYDTRFLKRGLYFIKLKLDNGNISTYKFLKQ